MGTEKKNKRTHQNQTGDKARDRLVPEGFLSKYRAMIALMWMGYINDPCDDLQEVFQKGGEADFYHFSNTNSYSNLANIYWWMGTSWSIIRAQ